MLYAKEECSLKMQTCASCQVRTYHPEDLIAGTTHKTLDEEDLNEPYNSEKIKDEELTEMLGEPIEKVRERERVKRGNSA